MFLLALLEIHDDATSTSRAWPITDQAAEEIIRTMGAPAMDAFVPSNDGLEDLIKGSNVLYHFAGDEE